MKIKKTVSLEPMANSLRLDYPSQVDKWLMKIYLIGLKHMKKQVIEPVFLLF